MVDRILNAQAEPNETLICVRGVDGLVSDFRKLLLFRH